MAANFWTSTHYKHWMLNKAKLATYRDEVQKRTGFSGETENILLFSFIQLIQTLGKILEFNQIVVATATTFFRRYYLNSSLIENDPRIVAPTVLYLAAKVEEMGQIQPSVVLKGVEKVRHNKRLPDDRLCKDLKVSDIYQCEMTILDRLKFEIVIFHPYYDLERYVKDNGHDVEKVFHTSWGILNDAQRSDISLIHPPCIVALAAFYLACIHLNVDSRGWFDELNVNLDEVRQCSEDILKASEEDEARPSKLRMALDELYRYY